MIKAATALVKVGINTMKITQRTLTKEEEEEESEVMNKLTPEERKRVRTITLD